MLELAKMTFPEVKRLAEDGRVAFGLGITALDVNERDDRVENLDRRLRPWCVGQRAFERLPPEALGLETQQPHNERKAKSGK